MTDAEAKKHLRAILGAYTHGSILHLMADFLRDADERARRDGDDAKHQRFAEVAATLYVVGIGIDAACPPARIGGDHNQSQTAK